jgi:EAL domain-containing protein (putative c-di-GMP-specific phosphodiesterase class I)
MEPVWSVAQVSRLVGTGRAYFYDRYLRLMPAPPALAKQHPLPPGTSRMSRNLEHVANSDRIAMIQAHSDAFRQPGHLTEATYRYRADGVWYWNRVQYLNLLGTPEIDAFITVVSQVEAIGQSDPSNPERGRVPSAVTPWAVTYLDDAGVIFKVEGTPELVFGLPGHSIIGRSALELVHPEDMPTCLAQGEHAFRNPGTETRLRHRIRRSDGETCFVDTVMNYTALGEGFRLEFRDASAAVVQDLRSALEQDQFVLHYQPVLDVRTGELAGAEALVRRIDPERGFIPPGEFIPRAESTGFIVELGEALLRTACQEAARWRPSLHIAVNLSARQLGDERIIEAVSDALTTSGLAPARLVLEVTETAVMEDPERSLGFLNDLKDLGVRLAIDDFGTGYSSLVYLRRMPVTAVKIDRSFIDGLGHEAEDTAIVTSVVSLAHALGISAVAEGVETEEHRAHLALMGCDLAQGFLWSRAIPAEEFRRLAAVERFPTPPVEPVAVVL